MSGLLKLVCILLIALLVYPGRAIAISCNHDIVMRMNPQPSRDQINRDLLNQAVHGLSNGDTKPFQSEKIQNVLFLGDKQSGELHGAGGPSVCLGCNLAQAMPTKKIVSADAAYSRNQTVTTSQGGKYRKEKVDHAAKLPYRDNSMDAVVARNLSCVCKGHEPGKTCGGIPLDVDRAADFFSEVSRILNNNNPEAFAIIAGQVESRDLHVVQPLLDAAIRVNQSQQDTLVETIRNPGQDGALLGFRVSPRSARSQ